jgi:hypothetical protein
VQAVPLFRFTATSRLAAAGSAIPSGGVLTLTLPARSATLGVASPPATSFYTVAPCRVADTRTTPNGPYAGPALAAGATRTFDFAGRCGVPASVRAVSVNLAVTGPSAAGSCALFPAGGAASTAAITYSAGQTRGNNAISGVGASAGLSVRCSQAGGTVHAILDVNGYFE